MAIQKFNIKDMMGEQKKSSPLNSKKDEKKKGGVLTDLAQTGLAALPFISKKYILIGGGVIFIVLYGTVSLIIDIISLF